MKSILSLTMLMSLLYGEKSLYEQGEILYTAKNCNICHGIKAEGMGSYPMLANRAKGFLAYKLTRFRDGIFDRPEQEVMFTYAQKLSDADIDAITTYLNKFVEKATEGYNPPYETWGDGGS